MPNSSSSFSTRDAELAEGCSVTVPYLIPNVLILNENAPCALAQAELPSAVDRSSSSRDKQHAPTLWFVGQAKTLGSFAALPLGLTTRTLTYIYIYIYIHICVCTNYM